MRTLVASIVCLVLAGCGSTKAAPEQSPTTTTPPPSETSSELPVDQPDETNRPTYTAEQCEAEGGTVVGDIGDGAIHRPDYLCPSGDAPIASVPLGVEGSVCCPPASTDP